MRSRIWSVKAKVHVGSVQQGWASTAIEMAFHWVQQGIHSLYPKAPTIKTGGMDVQRKGFKNSASDSDTESDKSL